MTDLSTPFLGFYPKEMKIYIHTEICTYMFIAALLVTAPKLDMPQMSTNGKWINRVRPASSVG